MPTIAEIRQQYPQYNDLTDEQLATSLHQKFYSDMPVEQFNQKIGMGKAQPSGPGYVARTLSNVPESASGVAHQMSPAGMGEELASIYGMGQRIKKRLEEAPQHPISVTDVASRAAKHLYDAIVGLPQTFEKDPVGSIGQAALMVAGPEALAAKGVKAADEAAQAARIASIPERLANLSETPAPEALTATAEPAAQRAAALKARGAEQMNVAKASEQALPTETMAPIVEDLKAKAAEQGYNPRIHKRAKALFKEFDAMLPEDAAPPPIATIGGKPIPVSPKTAEQIQQKLSELPGAPAPKAPKTTTLKAIHQLRQQIRSVSASPDPNERLVGYHMKDALDDYMGQFMEGQKLTEGMKDYAKASTALEIKALADRAEIRFGQSSQQGRDQVYRTEFARLARNEKKMRMIRAVSPQAAEKITELAGGGKPLQKVLRGIGTAAPRSIMSFSLDHIAGHLLHSIIPGGPYTIMAVGAGAKYLGGKLASESIEDIMNTIMAEPQLRSLKKAVSPSVFDTLMSRPRTAQAIRNWAEATGPRKEIAKIALTSAIAKEVNRPDLQQRIKDELDNIDQQNTTTVPETMAAR